MNISLILAVLRGEWMINESSIPGYLKVIGNYFDGTKKANVDYMAGNGLMDLFSELEMPAVPDNIALIPINGVMTKADVCGGMGTRSLTGLVNAAANDPNISSIILFFEGVPGGQVDGTKIFADEIKAAAAKKPVLSAISGMCCSAGVWAATQSTEIYATSNTDIFGCIGVVASIAKGEEDPAYELIYSDHSPDKNAESRDPEVLKQGFLNPVCIMFQDAVKEGRGDNLKIDGKGVLSGATFLAGAAKKNGLIDGTMSFQKIVQRANYLSKKQNSNTMSATNNIAKPSQFKFQNVLAAAKASALVPVEEGFAMTEEELNTLDANIGAMNASISVHETAMQLAGDSLSAALATITAQAITIKGLEAQVAEYAPKATVIKNLKAGDDKFKNDSKMKCETSVDREAARMVADSALTN